MTTASPDLVEVLKILYSPEGQTMTLEEINREVLAHIEVPELLPKHYVPKKKYTEISRGIGIEYEERIVESHNAKAYVMSGWNINNPDQAYLWLKWKNAIIAMEQT